MNFKQVEPHYIKNFGNWKPDTQDVLYSANIPINNTKEMLGTSENHKV